MNYFPIWYEPLFYVLNSFWILSLSTNFYSKVIWIIIPILKSIYILLSFSSISLTILEWFFWSSFTTGIAFSRINPSIFLFVTFDNSLLKLLKFLLLSPLCWISAWIFYSSFCNDFLDSPKDENANKHWFPPNCTARFISS